MKRVIVLFILCIPFVGRGQSLLSDSLITILNSRKPDSVQIDQFNELANAFLKDNPAKSRELASRLIDLNTVPYLRGKARSLTILGNSYWSEGAYEFALQYYLQSARAYQNVNDSLGLGRTYNNIGEVYKKLNDYKKSLEYLTASLSLKKNKAPISLYNIGELYLFMSDYEKAKNYFRQSLTLANTLEDNRAIAYCYWGLGKIKAYEKSYGEANELFHQSLSMWEELGEIRSIIQLHQEIGTAYTLQKNFPNAKSSLEKSTSMIAGINVPDLKLNNYFLAYKIDSTQGNLSTALSTLLQYNLLKDSIYTLQKADQISKLQTIYETEVRARENQELRYQQTLSNSQLKNQQAIIITISVGLLLTATMAVLLFRQQKQILLSNRKLAEKNEKIIHQNTAIQSQAAELKNLNLQLQDLNKYLETRIQERTQQLYLQNQKLTDYTFLNAHKLRAPVATILGLINLIPRLPADEVPEAITHLKNCGEHLDSVIRELGADLEGGIIDSNEQN